jgi:CRISPR/Cas system CMR-associated protein Cmr5 small subunit
MERGLLNKIAFYTSHIQKIGDLNLLSAAEKAQEESSNASKKARKLYEHYINSIR